MQLLLALFVCVGAFASDEHVDFEMGELEFQTTEDQPRRMGAEDDRGAGSYNSGSYNSGSYGSYSAPTQTPTQAPTFSPTSAYKATTTMMFEGYSAETFSVSNFISNAQILFV